MSQLDSKSSEATMPLVQVDYGFVLVERHSHRAKLSSAERGGARGSTAGTGGGRMLRTDDKLRDDKAEELARTMAEAAALRQALEHIRAVVGTSTEVWLLAQRALSSNVGKALLEVVEAAVRIHDRLATVSLDINGNRWHAANGPAYADEYTKLRAALKRAGIRYRVSST